MGWQEYQEIYYNFELSLSQTMVSNIIAGTITEGFPARLPKSLKSPLMSDLRQVVLAMLEVASKAPKISGTGEEIANIDSYNSETASRIIAAKSTSEQSVLEQLEGDLPWHMLTMSIAATLLKIRVEDLDFRRLLSAQQLVMVLAHLDAFLADSVRALCYARPEMLKSQKKIDWETVISCGDWNRLFTLLVEEYIFHFGWKAIHERVRSLQKQHRLIEDFPKNDLDLLEEAQNIRNIIVHNGGRVSQEYLARTRNADLQIGQFVPVTSEYVDKVATAASFLASELFTEVSNKFFGLDMSEIGTVFMAVNP